ncbi:hypothetical protein LTR86_005385 [Recurvomyces mirabilis]|nr:hypothetical protein LTR86_005385 [Recurvomyces mirabilis]
MSAMQHTGERSAFDQVVVTPHSCDDGFRTELPAQRLASRASSPLLRGRRESPQRIRISSDDGTEMISPEEYATLPPSIQRKYFTSAERLHISQAAAADQRKKHCRKKIWLSPRPSLDCHRHTASEQRARTPSDASSDRHSLAELRSGERPITPEQAAWFFALPEKVRRQHFSKEERIQSEEGARVLQVTSSGSLVPASHASSNIDETVKAKPAKALPVTSDQTQVTPVWAAQHKQTYQQQGDSVRPHSPSTIGLAVTAPSAFTAEGKQRMRSGQQKVVVRKARSFNRALYLTPIALPPPRLAPIPASPVPETLPVLSPPQQEKLSWRLSRPCDDFYVPSPIETPPAKPFEEPVVADVTRPQLRPRAITCPVLDLTSERARHDIPNAVPTSTSECFPIQRTSLVLYDTDDNASVQTSGPLTPSALSSTSSQASTLLTSAEASGLITVQPNSDGSPTRTPRGLNDAIAARTAATSVAAWPTKQSCEVAVVDLDPLALEPLDSYERSAGANDTMTAFDLSVPREKRLTRVWKSIRRH